MKPSAIIAGYFAVAVAFFLVGHFTAPAPSFEPDAGKTPPSKGSPTDRKPVPAKKGSHGLDSIKASPAPTPTPKPGPAATGESPDARHTPPASDASPSIGSKKAKVIVLEVSDFQCPVCRRAYTPLKELEKDFPGEVLLVFKQNPLKMHRNALNAAAASMAAARQGKFWEYADKLFENQRALSESDLLGYAGTMGLDVSQFEKDYRDDAIRSRALAEGTAASELGARGTPSFFVNGRKQVGWASYQSVVQQVRREIKAVDTLVAAGKSLEEARRERVRANLPDPGPMLNTDLGQEFKTP